MTFAEYWPCFSALRLPIGAPLPGAPPCILQRRFLCTAGDRHGFPLRVRAPHRDAGFMRDGFWCMGLILAFACYPSSLDGADDRLAALVDVDVFDGDLLLALAAVPVQGLE